MRFKITLRSQHTGLFIAKLSDGRKVEMRPDEHRHLRVGDTGRVVQDRNRINWKVDAIDADF